MAPKKLTDCPENLRESIDWLIQVRHGGDKNGLEHLAKALTKLIEEVIVKSFRSFCDHLCTILDPAGQRYECCREKIQSIKALKAEVDKAGNVEENKLQEFLDKVIALKNGCETNHRVDASTDKVLSDVQSRLEKLEGLRKNLSGFTSDPSPILKQLCTGLETFLGFDAKTKGYTGKGIVYSDLDRLCDAVMAFLLGVLDCVKYDESVTIYDTSDINQSIKVLKTSIGGGQQAFNDAINQLSKWLGAHSEEMNKRVNRVMNGLTEFLGEIKNIESNMKNVRSENISTQFITWSRVAASYHQKAKEVETACGQLDIKLRNRLKGPMSVVIQFTKNLEDAWKRKGLADTFTRVQKQLTELPGNLKNEIDGGAKRSVQDHEKIVKKLQDRVKNDIETLRDRFLQERLNVTITDLSKAVTTSRKNALNLGGLNNKVVEAAIKTIENALKTADTVLDRDTLKKLKSEPVGNQMKKIKEELVEKSTVTGELNILGETIGEPEAEFLKQETLLRELVDKAKTDLGEALKCADEHAKSLGGLSNDAVVEAINGIQGMLDKVSNGEHKVETLEKLKELKTDFMDAKQIESIKAALNKNENAANVEIGFENLKETCGDPQQIFNKEHQPELQRLAENIQRDLVAAMANATEYIQTHGGMNAKKVKLALEAIEEALHEVETPSIGIENLFKILTVIEGQFDEFDRKVDPSFQTAVKSAVQQLKLDSSKLTTALRSDQAPTKADIIVLIKATNIYAVEALCIAEMYSYDKSGNVKPDVVEMVKHIKMQIQTLNNAYSTNSIRMLHSTINPKLDSLKKNNSSYAGKKVSDLDKLEIGELTNKIETAEKSLIRSLVEFAKPRIDFYFSSAKSLTEEIDTQDEIGLKTTLEALEKKLEDHTKVNHIKEFSTLLNSISSQFDKLRMQHSSSPNVRLKRLLSVILEIEKPAWKAIIQTQATLFQTALDFARADVGVVVEKAKKAIKAAEEEYQLALNGPCSRIDGYVIHIRHKASSDTLESILADVEPQIQLITTAINEKSVFNEDKVSRTAHFTNLHSQITYSLNSLSEAYKNVYKSVAMSYLSGAISKIKGAVGQTERTYKLAVSEHIDAIRKKFNQITHLTFSTTSGRDVLTTFVDTDFVALQAKVKDNSTFTTDADSRKECYTQLQNQIRNTVKALSAAYVEAYNCSAKTYLSKAIREIKEKVGTAEKKYEKAINIELLELKRHFDKVNHANVVDKNHHSALKSHFDAPFKLLESTVKEYSAFKSDIANRTKCFSKLKDLINNTVQTQIESAKKFDACSTAAKAYLGESYENAKQGIKQFGSSIHWKVTEIFDSITEEIQNLCAITRKYDIRALKMSLAEQMEDMKILIEDDCATGIKGLLQIMQENEDMLFEVNINDTLYEFSEKFRLYLSAILIYCGDENTVSLRPKDSLDYVNTHQLENIVKIINNLFQNFEKHNFDHKISKMICDLRFCLDELNPTSFFDVSSPLLGIVKKGLTSFNEELSKAYVNVYSGKTIKWEDKDNPEKAYCAKVFFTVIYMLFYELHELFYYCTTKLKSHWIDGRGSLENHDDLKDLLKKLGYKTENLMNEKNGTYVAGKLFNGFHKYGEFKHAPEPNIDFNVYIRSLNNNINTEAVILNIYYNLENYFQVSHLVAPSSPRYPSSVFEILSWLCGLKYSAFYDKLAQRYKHLAKREHYNALTYMASDAYGLHLPYISVKTYNLLIKIAGHGDAHTFYGCEYFSNKLGLYYPSDATICFDMLIDLLSRLCPVLTFLHSQCRLDELNFGWSGCKFGKGVKKSVWQCNLPQNRLTTEVHDCSVTSPLQLYLTDGLKSMLPHTLVSNESKLVCSICSAKSGGMPCLTPLGFRAFSGSNKTGADICFMLDDYCHSEGHFINLYRSLTSVVGIAPKNFPDIFSFYCQLTHSWSLMPTVRDAFTDHGILTSICREIENSIACNYEVARNLIDPCRNFYEYKSHGNHSFNNGYDLKYLVGCKQDVCGNYIQSLNVVAYATFVPEHSAKYLSWIVYVCPNVADFLDELINALGSISCHEYGCKECHNESQCHTGGHGTHECGCQSVIHCSGLMPTLYRFGFTFGDIEKLTINTLKRTCHEFYGKLKNVRESALMVNFLSAIDTFMFTLRRNFIYTLVALWLLSFLYLIHIFIIRLDLLHIKSHLHSPSSHRIAAQSLLAAARVKALNKVLYLQP